MPACKTVNWRLSFIVCSPIRNNGAPRQSKPWNDMRFSVHCLNQRQNSGCKASAHRLPINSGNEQMAIQHARELNDPFNQQFSEKLAQPAPSHEQVRFDVPFVRQHFKTCAPATMAALGRYWKMPAEHLALVETICYDGTPAWQQRDWVERNGWLVREFRVTWESALALLIQGIPFAITTVEATSAHMQAVMGFDQTRGTLLLRDPSQPYCLESHAKVFFERYRPSVLRGMVFLPQSESSRLTVSRCLITSFMTNTMP